MLAGDASVSFPDCEVEEEEEEDETEPNIVPAEEEKGKDQLVALTCDRWSVFR